ncbi:ATP-binding protein [Marisediminicola sp. LYQ85]|uniref:sensor histidine kinase n=1 Tax=Marisediminicola sp. LYQ85 TaxID=3391062 RepID=UPI00398374B9
MRRWLPSFLDASPIVRQVPITVLFLFISSFSLYLPNWEVMHPGSKTFGLVMIVVATILAGVFTAKPRRRNWALLVPACDFVALGALRYASEERSAIFASLAVLPLIWFAAEAGRRNVVYAAIGSAIALLIPPMIEQIQAPNGSIPAGAVAAPFILAIAAVVINELTLQNRSQLTQLRALANEREQLLDAAVGQVATIERAHADVLEAERVLRGVWDAVTEQSIIGTDTRGTIEMLNSGSERMLGVRAAEVVDRRHVVEFHVLTELQERARTLEHPVGVAGVDSGFTALVELARTGSADTRDWTYVRPDGSTIPVALSVTRRMNSDGETVGYLFVAADMTREREVAKLKDKFVGLISHELRTPLSSILGYLELLRDDDEGTELTPTQLQYLGVAERNAHRLLSLVGDLLFTAQVESGSFALNRAVESLAPIVRASIESATPAAAAAGVTLTESISDAASAPLVDGDSGRLGQAFDNLLSNAIKFTPRGGTVTAGLAIAADGAAAVTVTDSGIGIPPAELDRLFTPFFRASTATKNAVPGVGLGLVITRAIATAHGGSVGVSSVVGEGTTFTLSLPVTESVRADERQHLAV